MKLNKSCPILDRFGVCDGTDLVADNNKQKCEGEDLLSFFFFTQTLQRPFTHLYL